MTGPALSPIDTTGQPTTPPQQAGTQAPAPAPAGSLVRQPTVADSMSPSEYEEALMRTLRQARDSNADLPDAESSNPLMAAWQHFKYRIPRIPDAAVRGVSEFLNQGSDLLMSAGVGLATMPTGDEGSPSLSDLAGSNLRQKVNDAGGSLAYVRQQNDKSGFTEAFNTALTRVTGAASEDPVLKMTKNIAQFAAGFEMTGGLSGEAAAGGWLTKLGINALRGGITEAAFFDPKEASLMNTLAATEIPGLKEMGKALSIHPDDPELVARFKHLANGGILTAAGEAALLSGAKLLGYAKQIAKARANGASDAEIAPVIAKAQAEQKTVTAVGNGTYTAPKDIVKVTPNPDGTGTIQPNRPVSPPETQVLKQPLQPGGRPTAAATSFATDLRGTLTKGVSIDPSIIHGEHAGGANIHVTLTGSNTAEISDLAAKEVWQGQGTAALNDITQLADKHGIDLTLEASPYGKNAGTPEQLRDLYRQHGFESDGGLKMVRRAGDQPSDFRETPGSVKPEEQIPVPDAQAAQPDVDAFNQAAQAHIAANAPLTATIVNDYKTMAQRYSLASSDEDMARLIQTTRFNNVNYASEPTQVLAHAAALESAFKEEFAKNAQGWAETADRARKFLPDAGEPLSPELARGLSAPDLAARTLALDAIRFQQVSDITKLSQMLDANPTSGVLMDNMRTGLNNFMEVSRIVAGHDSEVGRALNIMQNRGALRESFAATRDFQIHPDFPEQASKAIQESDDGFTIDPRTGKVVNKGFSVGRGRTGGKQTVLPKAEATPEALAAAAEKNKAFLAKNPNYHMGGWVDDGKAYIEPVEVFSKRGAAVKAGMQAGEAGVGDLSKYAKGEDGFIPTGGSAETAQSAEQAAALKKNYMDGMTDEEVAALGRMVRATDGDLRDAAGITEAAAMMQKTLRENLSEASGPMAKAGVVAKASLNSIREFFINYLFGNPKTQAVVIASGNMNAMFDDVARWGAGVVTRNSTLRQQGADQMYALFKEQGEAVGAYKQSFVEGRSVLNPQPDKSIIGGLTGKVTRLPTRALGAAHEYLLDVNYRSFVRADALADGRAAGLEGDALETRVQQDLQTSFDKNTGVALRQDAWDYAMDQTFQNPLRPGSFPRAIQDYANKNPGARWIIPVWKLGVNMFDKAWQWTPGLNEFNKGARAIFDKGGPEASVLRTKSAIAASVYTAVYLAAQAGNLTGDGPKDPDIRKLWLQNNQPNSFRFGDKGNWIDYSRMEPWATTIGTVANFHELTSEWGDKKADANHSMAFAIPAAIVANLANKSYFQGLTRMSDLVTSGDPENYAKFMRQTAVAATPLPLHGTMNATNPDPYFREVRSMLDAEKASLPGFSTALDPKFNLFGEPTLKNPSYVQRTFLPFFKNQAHSESVEDDMVELNARLKPWAEQYSVPGVQATFDLTDKKTWANGAADPKKSPWIRFNELLRSPDDGSENFRTQLTNLVHSPEWDDLAGRTPGFTGSGREDKVKLMKAEAEQKAWHTVLDEYPTLADSVRAVQRQAAAAKRAGPQGVADAKADQ